ncbi:acyltransferase family protein [Vibrio hangzhouensis]|uniref:acyltransferase family protein n=1 Tax=Vibrio hangzhouensis TaxID=462991 RepID=UPI00135AE5A9|nr:acyltransferase [Vibrio hangzhouensis]
MDNNPVRDNNFDLIRIVLSTIVFMYHISVLSPIDGIVFGFFSGEFAVECFFVISGYLIVYSYNKSNSLKKYSKSRIVRILPLYLIVILLTFILGLIISNVDIKDFVYNGGLKFIIFNSIFMNFMSPSLPGVFEDNVITAVNGSLWTIKIEVMFYFAVPLIFDWINKGTKRYFAILILYALSILCFYFIRFLIIEHGVNPSINNQLPSLLCFFMAGAVLNYIRPSDKLMFVLFLLSTMYLLVFDKIYAIHPIALASVVYFFSYLIPFRIIIPKCIGDISYGMYIVHFPVIQYFTSRGWLNDFGWGFLLCILVVIVLSLLSWHCLEKRLLKYNKSRDRDDLLYSKESIKII